MAKKDFLDELIAESTRNNPSFPGMVDAASERRRLFRELRLKREEAGLTQRKVAERMGASSSAVARIERGSPGTRLSLLDRYALAIGYRVEWQLSETAPSRALPLRKKERSAPA